MSGTDAVGVIFLVVGYAIGIPVGAWLHRRSVRSREQEAYDAGRLAGYEDGLNAEGPPR